jgi:hypothetical protein
MLNYACKEFLQTWSFICVKNEKEATSSSSAGIHLYLCSLGSVLPDCGTFLIESSV